MPERKPHNQRRGVSPAGEKWARDYDNQRQREREKEETTVHKDKTKHSSSLH